MSNSRKMLWAPCSFVLFAVTHCKIELRLDAESVHPDHLQQSIKDVGEKLSE